MIQKCKSQAKNCEIHQSAEKIAYSFKFTHPKCVQKPTFVVPSLLSEIVHSICFGTIKLPLKWRGQVRSLNTRGMMLSKINNFGLY
jgi:hypothetical protein